MDPKSINLFLVLDTEESEPEGSLLANPPLERCDTLVTIRPVAFQMKKEKEEEEGREEKKKKRKETENLKILWNPWEYPAFKGSRRIVPRIHYDWFGVCDFASLESKAKFSARHFTSQESGEKKIPRLAENFRSEEGTDREEDHDG